MYFSTSLASFPCVAGVNQIEIFYVFTGLRDDNMRVLFN